MVINVKSGDAMILVHLFDAPMTWNGVVGRSSKLIGSEAGGKV